MLEVKILRLSRFLLSFVILSLFIINIASAFQINVDKENLQFNDLRRAGYASDFITITSNNPNDIKISYSVTGDLKNFITIASEKEMILNSASPLKLMVSIRPDNSIGNGIHEGTILLTFQEVNSAQISNANVEPFVINYKVDITDKIIKQATVSAIVIDDINQDSPINALITITNKGNVEIKPSLVLNLKDINGILKSYTINTNETIMPSQEKTITYSQNSNELSLGQYNLEANLMIDNNMISQQSQIFYVLDKNQSIQKVILTDIQNNDKVHVNSEMHIKALIYNKGPDASVTFRGKIYLNDEFIADFQSPEITSMSNKDSEIIISFKPVKLGIYKVKGHIEYGPKSSLDIESAFEAVPESEVLKEVPLSGSPVLAMVLALVAIFVMVRINIYRKNRSNKKKR
jgi:hypothetical protein